MLQYKAKLRNWGNSLGIVVPKEEATKQKLHPDQEVNVIITPSKTLKVKDIYGKLKFKQSTDQIMKEIDEDLDSKFF
ncbi:hypothetical protein HYV80_06040 [Candidatus Woesearchaeota archaeon]|nr:hypothetical protein [Candidatus Woesearchaeota archaeon]